MDIYTLVTFFFGSFLLFGDGTLGDGDKGRGFGEDIDWVSFEDSKQIAKESNKPIMLIIHKTWCGACKALKPKFAESNAIKDLSSKFVMVNVQDDEEPKASEFQPDGGYIPRILFFDSDSVLREDLYNKIGNPKYKYYYSSAQMVVTAMHSAVKAFGGGSIPDEL